MLGTQKMLKARRCTVSETVECIDETVNRLTMLVGELGGKLSPIRGSEHVNEYESIIQHQAALLIAVREFKNKLEDTH